MAKEEEDDSDWEGEEKKKGKKPKVKEVDRGIQIHELKARE